MAQKKATTVKLKKPFDELYGRRVVLPFPIVEEQTEGGLILTPSAQKAKTEEMLDDYLRVEVIQAGKDCERVKDGDIIFIPPRIVQPGRSDMLTLSPTEKYLIVNEQDIVGKW